MSSHYRVPVTTFLLHHQTLDVVSRVWRWSRKILVKKHKVLVKTNQTIPNSMMLPRFIIEFLWPPFRSSISLRIIIILHCHAIRLQNLSTIGWRLILKNWVARFHPKNIVIYMYIWQVWYETTLTAGINGIYQTLSYTRCCCNHQLIHTLYVYYCCLNGCYVFVFSVLKIALIVLLYISVLCCIMS